MRAGPAITVRKAPLEKSGGVFCFALFAFALPIYACVANHNGSSAMANREQKSNREKKKPKSDKNAKNKPVPPPFVAPASSGKQPKGK
jgi:hypothetical protein